MAGTLSVSVAGFSLDVGDQFVIIDNKDEEGGNAIDGVFDNLDPDADGRVTVGATRFSITYAGGDDGNDVVLTVVEIQDNAVFLYGTSGDDTIVISPVGNPGSVEWTLNGVSRAICCP